MAVWVHVWRGEVRWGDMDSYGHVNHTVFFRYLETARVACLAEVCGDMPLPLLVVADIGCKFPAEIVFPATVEVRSSLANVRGGSLVVEAEIWSGGRRCAVSRALLVCVDAVRHKPTRFPPDFAARLAEVGAGREG